MPSYWDFLRNNDVGDPRDEDWDWENGILYGLGFLIIGASLGGKWGGLLGFLIGFYIGFDVKKVGEEE